MSEIQKAEAEAKQALNPILSRVDYASQIFARHHILLIVLLAGVLAWWGIGKYDAILSLRANQKYQEAQNALVIRQKETSTLQTKLAAEESYWNKQKQILLQQNNQLAARIVESQKAVQRQTHEDFSLTTNETVARLSQQTAAQPGEIKSQGNSLLVDLPVSRKIVADLDTLAPLRAQLADTQQQLQNETTIAKNAKADVVIQKQLVSSLDLQITAQKKRDSAELGVCKAQLHKAKRNWFVKGFLVGGGVALYLLKLAGGL